MQKNNQPKKILSTLAAGICAVILFHAGNIANAQLISYEGFNYTLGTTPSGTSLNGGTGWTNGSNWFYSSGSTGNGGSITNGLSYTDGSGNQLVTSPGAFYNLANSVNSTAGTFTGRIFTNNLGNLASVNTNVLWLSFLWRDNSPGTNSNGTLFFRGATVSLMNSAAPTVPIGEMGMPNYGPAAAGGLGNVLTANPNFAVYGAGGQYNPSYLTSVPGISNTVFVVLKLTVDNVAGSLDSFQIWVNPTLGSGDLTNTSAGYFTNYTGLELSSANMIDFRASGISTSKNILVVGEEVIDEVRLGNTFADVAPFTASASAATIQASLVSGNVNLSWPLATGAGYSLESSTNLTPPVTWNAVVASLATNAGIVSTSLPATNSQTFFHLKK